MFNLQSSLVRRTGAIEPHNTEMNTINDVIHSLSQSPNIHHSVTNINNDNDNHFNLNSDEITEIQPMLDNESQTSIISMTESVDMVSSVTNDRYDFPINRIPDLNTGFSFCF